MKENLISIVIPVFEEEGNITPLLDELVSVIQEDFPKRDYEIILTNDGSQDNSWQEITKYKPKNSNIIGINLNRNYGQSVALDAGFQKASGDIIVSMDSDGQNDPKDILKLYNELVSMDYDIVTGAREKRQDPLWMRFITKVAKFLRRILINDGVKDSGCTLRVYRPRVVKNLYLWAEMHRYIIAIAKVNGFSIGELPVNHRPRNSGKSKYNWKKSIKGLIDLLYIWFIAKYESRPLHIFGTLGILNTSLGGLLILFSFYQRIFENIGLSDNGWLIIGIFFFQIGAILFVFGITIDIMIRTYYNTSRDQRYIIKEVRENSAK